MSSSLNGQVEFDLAVIGGGINGAGIARDAAGRGLKVLLCEQDDFGQHTSSASTKLIHGGLRYLENYHFGLVRRSLREREILLRSAPHIIWPLRFVLPYDSSIRPRWMIRAGMLIYDSLAPMTVLQKSKAVDLSQHEAGLALNAKFQHAFEYSDCWVQDSRLVVLNIADAAKFGACVLSRTRCVDLIRERNGWQLSLARTDPFGSGQPKRYQIQARAVVNAAGAWVNTLAEGYRPRAQNKPIRLIRGSHIVVPRLFDHDHAYIFQNEDQRVLFCIPYEQDFTLLGTTEVATENIGNGAQASESEIDYLCQAVNRYVRASTTPADAVWSFTGVRVLLDGSADTGVSKISREYVLDFDDSAAPIVTVFGGKITTYRLLAEDVLRLLSRIDGFDKPRWTRRGVLPGGDTGGATIEQFAASLRRQHSWLPARLAYHYACHYGSEANSILGGCHGLQDMGREYSPGLFQSEVDYLLQNEFAECADDVIWRRTRHGIRMNRMQIDELNAYIERQLDCNAASGRQVYAPIHS